MTPLFFTALMSFIVCLIIILHTGRLKLLDAFVRSVKTRKFPPKRNRTLSGFGGHLTPTIKDKPVIDVSHIDFEDYDETWTKYSKACRVTDDTLLFIAIQTLSRENLIYQRFARLVEERSVACNYYGTPYTFANKTFTEIMSFVKRLNVQSQVFDRACNKLVAKKNFKVHSQDGITGVVMPSALSVMTSEIYLAALRSKLPFSDILNAAITKHNSIITNILKAHKELKQHYGRKV